MTHERRYLAIGSADRERICSRNLLKSNGISDSGSFSASFSRNLPFAVSESVESGRSFLSVDGCDGEGAGDDLADRNIELMDASGLDMPVVMSRGDAGEEFGGGWEADAVDTPDFSLYSSGTAADDVDCFS